MGDAVLTALIFAALFVFMLVFFGLRYRQEVGERIRHIRAIGVGASGINIEFYEKAVLQKEGRSLSPDESERTLRKIEEGRILWVDDAPHHNELEIAALRGRGVAVDSATSNDEALDRVSADPDTYDLVLSDVDRGPVGTKAGLELPQRLRAAGVQTPIAFYVGHLDRPTTDLGDPVFAAPSKLFEYIGEQLEGNRPGSR
jgi:CheY-like chemotaxis protein